MIVRENYLPAPHFFNLNHACIVINEAFGQCYLVGSATERRDYRDVDVRCIMEDPEFDRVFPKKPSNPRVDAAWSIVCASIALWLSQHTGLPIDFQIQKQTKANEQHDGPRQPLGIFVNYVAGGDTE